MTDIIRKVALVAAAVLVAVAGAFALDLPVEKVKGQQFYVYKVKKGESVYGVSKQLGISREDIVKYNPQAADGLNKNMKLFFPVDVFGPEPEPVAVQEPEIVEELPVSAPSTVAVMLPFGLDKEEPSKLNSLYLDFYKGFLIGVDTLCNRSGRMIEIRAYDTDAGPDCVRTLLDTDSFISKASVIIAPDGAGDIAEIASRAATTGAYVLNLFNIRDTLQSVNPAVVQANIPQQAMYELAASAFASEFEGYTPVILRNISGRNEKEAFTAHLASRCRERGVEPVAVEFEGTLRVSDFASLPLDDGQRYVVVPSSGTLAEFNKIAYVVQNWRERVHAIAVENPTVERAPAIEVFGYPDWTAFRGDALDILHRLDATVYSRFRDNLAGFEAAGVAQAFRRWYGEPMIESVPTQALLGFDAACCIIKNLRANDGAFDPMFPAVYNGVQSSFRFERADEGYVNASLYIIRFTPEGKQVSRVI